MRHLLEYLSVPDDVKAESGAGLFGVHRAGDGPIYCRFGARKEMGLATRAHWQEGVTEYAAWWRQCGWERDDYVKRKINRQNWFWLPRILARRSQLSRNLLAAIRAEPGVDLTHRWHGDTNRRLFAGFPEIAKPSPQCCDRMTPRSIMRRVLRTLTSQDVVLHRCLRKQDISVLSHSGHMGGGTEVRTIGWIPDFQHVHLPEFFIPAECRQRDRDFMDICARCDRVIVSSEYAYRDLKKFAPQHAHKAAVLQFVASPAPIDGAANLSGLKEKTLSKIQICFTTKLRCLNNHGSISTLEKMKQLGRK